MGRIMLKGQTVVNISIGIMGLHKFIIHILVISLCSASYIDETVVNLQSVKSVAVRFPASESKYREEVIDGYVKQSISYAIIRK